MGFDGYHMTAEKASVEHHLGVVREGGSLFLPPSLALTCKLSKSTELDADKLATFTTRPPCGARAIRPRRYPVITYGAMTFTANTTEEIIVRTATK